MALSHRYLFYITLSYGFGVLRPVQNVLQEVGHQFTWFVPAGDEAERFLRKTDTRLETVQAVKSWNPHAVLTSGNMIPHFFPGIKVQLFHGIDSGKSGEADIRGFYDLYCTQSPAKTHPFIALREQHRTFDFVETGWSKLDPLFTPHPKTTDFETDAPLILYAPTFSKSMTSTLKLYKTIKQLTREKPWHWMVKFHPKADPQDIEMYQALSRDNFNVISLDDPAPLLQAADVLLSDTSSIVTEFALLEKPVVTFCNLKPRNWMIHCTHPSELPSCLEQALDPSEALRQHLREYAGFIHPYRDGRSSYRVVEAVDNMIVAGTDHLAPKPLNLIRKFKMRKKLGYFKR